MAVAPIAPPSAPRRIVHTLSVTAPEPHRTWTLPRLRFGLLVVGMWTLLGVLGASQAALNLAYHGQPVAWPRTLAVSLVDVYTCAAFIPVVLWLVRRLPLRGGRWMRAGLVHAAAVAAMVVLKYALYLPLLQWLAPLEGYSLVDRFFFEFMAIASMIGIALGLEYHREIRERETRAARLEARLANAQMDVLRSQIRPHFLFNTMNAVSTLMRRDVDAADEMLALLCDLLRDTLDADAGQEVPLRVELRVLDRYLEIMRLRFADRLRVEVRVEDDAWDVPVPRFILQPLAENAIEHGIVRSARGGRIVVAAERAGGTLRITLTHDGPEPHEGGRLDDTRERLRQLYGPAAGLRLQRSPAGTELELRIPSIH